VGQPTGANWRQQDYDRQRREGYQKSKDSQQQHAREERQKHESGSRPRVESSYELNLWLKDLKLAWPVTTEDVTSAFRKLAMETHPDQGGSDQAFITVKRAYDQVRKLMA
jgi:uncharacterized protein YehS (DUF1456 family)